MPSNLSTSNQLFENSFYEKLTKTHNPSVVIAYTGIALFILIYAIVQVQLSLVSSVVFTFAGLLLFTLVEYLVHRFAYHAPDYKEEQAWRYKVHGYHHKEPRDRECLALPFMLALAVAALLFILFRWVLAERGYAFFAGFLMGYAAYLWVHYLVHTRVKPNNLFGYLLLHHQLHHYKYEDKAFGVSSPLWDIVFGTMPPKQKRKSNKVVGKAV